MAIVDELQKEHEKKVTALVAALSGVSPDSDWALAKALIHRAVHLCADRKAAEFCALATFLAEMIGHSHPLLHHDRTEAAHSDRVH